MKIISKAITVFIVLIFLTACFKEEMIKVDPNFELTFQRDGRTTVPAGTPFYIIPTGSGEFITLYDGMEGHVWGEPGSTGVDFNKADSLERNYPAAGIYLLTVVASSSGHMGQDLSRDVKTVEINVVDERNSFFVFNINGTDGIITIENEILFSVPDNVTNFNFIPEFGLVSDLSKVYVNGIEQSSGKDTLDFSQPVVYIVRAAQGNEKEYTVKFSTFPGSSEKAITKFELGGGEIGVIDEVNKTITIAPNYNTALSSLKLEVASSYGSKVLINNQVYSIQTKYNLSANGIKKIKVVAQNSSDVEYSVIVIPENAVTGFTFDGLIPAPTGVIDVASKTIIVDVLKGTDITKLVAKWTGSTGNVKIGKVVQTNGVTTNNFSNPVIYTFYKGFAEGDKYTVTVNVK